MTNAQVRQTAELAHRAHLLAQGQPSAIASVFAREATRLNQKLATEATKRSNRS